MRKNFFAALLLLVYPLICTCTATAKEVWPLTVKVLSTKNVEDPHGSFHFSKVFDNASAAWSHRVAEHVFVDSSDGNSYELVPQNPKDMLLPGSFQAKIEKRDMKVCERKDNGECRDVKFKIVAAVPTVKDSDPAPEHTVSAPATAPAQVAAPETAAQSSIAIESTPPGADIEIDRAFVGNTPSTVNIAPGSHEVTVKKKGFVDWTRKLNVTGGSVHLSADLDALPTQAPAAQ